MKAIKLGGSSLRKILDCLNRIEECKDNKDEIDRCIQTIRVILTSAVVRKFID